MQINVGTNFFGRVRKNMIIRLKKKCFFPVKILLAEILSARIVSLMAVIKEEKKSKKVKKKMARVSEKKVVGIPRK